MTEVPVDRAASSGGSSDETAKGSSAVGERRSSTRHRVVWTARWERLHEVRVVEIGSAGLRLETDRALGFGRASLVLGPTGSATGEALDVDLLWSRLVATVRGPYGEICPCFRHGLRVDVGSLELWERVIRRPSRRALRAGSGGRRRW